MKLEFKSLQSQKSPDTASKTNISTTKPGASLIVGLHLLPGHQRVAVSENGLVQKNDTTSIEIPKPHIPACSALHPTQPILLVGTSTSRLFVVNVGSDRVERILDGVTGTTSKIRANDVTPALSPAGGITKCSWSPDGSTFVTGYGNGSVRLWSRQGVLRSTIVESPSKTHTQQHALLNDQQRYIQFEPVLGLDFTSDSRNLVVARSRQILVHPLTQQSSKSNQGSISATNWSLPENEFIVSASFSQANGTLLVVTEVHMTQNSKYRIYDLLGRQVGPAGVLTNVQACSSSWSPNGELALIGLANSAVTLLSSAGTQLSTVKVHTGEQSQYNVISGIYTICWQEQLLVASHTGSVFLTQIFGQHVQFEDVLLAQVSANCINAVHASQDTDIVDKLQTKEAILSMKLGGTRQIVVLTKSQIYTWSLDQLNTPNVIPLPRQIPVETINLELGHQSFAIFNHEQAYIYQYDGRQKCQVRFGAAQNSPRQAKLSDGHFWTLIKDNSILAYDLTNGSPATARTVVLKSAPKKFVVSFDGQVAYLNQSGELHYGPQKQKLATNVKDVSFSETNGCGGLLALCENKLMEWVCVEQVLRNDAGLLLSKDYPLVNISAAERLESYKATPIAGVVINPNDVHMKTSPWVKSFYTNVSNVQGLLRLCQMADEQTLWAGLAAICLEQENYSTAELCYAALGKSDKVSWLGGYAAGSSGVGMSRPVTDQAELAAFKGDISGAENTYLRDSKLLAAIHLNIKHSKWDRALTLAVSNKQHIDFALALRQRWLEEIGLEETNDKYRQMNNQVRWDWEEVKSKLLEL